MLAKVLCWAVSFSCLFATPGSLPVSERNIPRKHWRFFMFLIRNRGCRVAF
jgi:hypothetical protein